MSEREFEAVAIGIDPGGVTGMACVGMDHEGTFWLLEHEQVDSRELGEEEAAAQIADLAWIWTDRHGCDVLVVEDFILRSKVTDRSLLSPVRITAKVETYLLRYGVLEDYGDIQLQQASAAKSIATDERLKHWGLWIRGRQHARDAARHCVVALRGL